MFIVVDCLTRQNNECLRRRLLSNRNINTNLMMSFDKYQQLPFKFLSRGFIDKVSLKKEILLYIPIKENCFYIKLLIIVEGNGI